MSIKSSRKKSLGYIVLILVMGAFIGSALGEVIGVIIPEGVVNSFCTEAVTGELGPTTLNLLIVTFTIGFTFKLNLIGIVGIFIAAYLLRWY